LGALLVDAALLERAGRLEPAAFYRAAHQTIFAIMLSLVESRTAVDFLTLANALATQGRLEECGGKAYLAALVDGMPRSTNIRHYADIVRETATARRLIEAATQLVDMAYAGERPVADLLTEADRIVIGLQAGSSHGRMAAVGQGITGLMADLEARQATSGTLFGITTGFANLDELTQGWQIGDMAIIAARPSIGKTALATNCAVAAARTGKRVAIFSLEMRRRQLEHRLVSSLSRVPLTAILSGQLYEADYSKIAGALEVLDALPLSIDDRAEQTVWDIRWTCRRLKAEHGLDLVIVDYVQLMTGALDRRGVTRNEELTDVSRRLKLLADECGVSVLLLSQLSRVSEQRGDTRPKLSDLRECLSYEDTYLVTDRGPERHTRDTSVATLNVTGTISSVPSRFLPRGEADTVCLTVSSGRRLVGTPDHPVLTADGWKPLGALTSEDAVAVARTIPAPPGGGRDLPHARWVGWMLGNGSMAGAGSPAFATGDPEVMDAFTRETQRLFGLIPRSHRHRSARVWQVDVTHRRHTSKTNACKAWLKEVGLWGFTAPQKHLPTALIENLSTASVAEIVGGLLDTDGSVVPGARGRLAVKFGSTSALLIEQYRWMLLRLGLVGRVDGGYMSRLATIPIYTVVVGHAEEVVRLREVVRLTGSRARRLWSWPAAEPQQGFSRLPPWVARELVAWSQANGISQSRLGYRDQGKWMDQTRLARALSTLPACPRLQSLVCADVLWDRVRSVTPVGRRKVFDRSVGVTRNFIANGIVVHNSGALEQDADLVLFLHRKHHREGGPTSLIVEKQRNGPTGTLALTLDRDIVTFTDDTGVTSNG